MRAHGAVSLVDCVSSLGGMSFEADEWQLDICVAGAQKCLSGPAGISPLTVSSRAWRLIEKNPAAPRWSYLSLLDWRERYLEQGRFPFTPSVSDVYGLEACLDEVLSLVNGRVPLIVELKSTRRYRALCERTAQLLDEYPGLCCIESFDPRIVRWFALHRPGMVRGHLAAGIRSHTSTSWYQSLPMSALLTNVLTRPHFAAYRHQDARRKLGIRLFKLLGGRLVAWTVQSPEDERRCRRLFGTVIFEYYKP